MVYFSKFGIVLVFLVLHFALRVVFWVGGEYLCGEVEKNKTRKHTQKKNKTQIKKKKVTHKILIPEWICGKAEIP